MQLSKRKREDLTYEEVNKLLRYDPLTGDLTWKVSPCNFIKVGSRIGSVHTYSRQDTKYLRTHIKGFVYYNHRVAFLLMTGRWPTSQIDHINHDGLDNRWWNLRDVSHSENQKNQKKNSKNTSGVAGVVWDKANAKWKAQIKRRHLGRFNNFEDAVAARKAAEIKYGFHPNHGKEKTQ